MRLRRLSAVLIPALAFVLTACPKPVDKPDGNDVEFDGGNPLPRDACSGGCAENQVCDTARKTASTAAAGVTEEPASTWATEHSCAEPWQWLAVALNVSRARWRV